MELTAPSRWRYIDFISDLHLQASDPLTVEAWRTYLQQTTADAVFILGDLFEVWVGDDVLSLEAGFERRCADALRAAAGRLDLLMMCGNRDFLMGASLMAACGASLLEDPTVLSFAQQRWLLTHGDALCLDDADYMRFRAKARSTTWQQDFLSKPLPERMRLATAMRAESEAFKRADRVYADVDTQAANALLHSTRAEHMVHGHTHRPARHLLDAERERLVLSDWDLCATPARAEVLRLRRVPHGDAESFSVERIPPAMAAAATKA